MDIQHILRADYLDILFDRRNKQYGSYELRRHYPKRARKALLTVVFGAGIAASVPVIAAHLGNHPVVQPPVISTVNVLNDLKQADKPKVDLPKPAQPVTPPPPHVSADFRPMKVAPDDEVINPPKPVDSLAGKEIAMADHTGEALDNSLGSDITKAGGKGTDIIDAPAPQKPVTWVEQMPAFNGDVNQWLSDHIRYPEAAREEGISGKVIVQFVVNEDGAITDAEVKKSVHPLLNTEALRVINAMPAWKPGKQNGKAVKVYFLIPVDFQLN